MELSLDRLTKHYGAKIAVDCLSTTMTPGVYGLLGANGAGKTTLMRMLCGILQPTSGDVLCNGRSIYEMGSAYRNLLGYLPQEFGYYPNYTAQEFLLYIAVLKGLPRHSALPRSEALLEMVGLANTKGKKIRTFSGGMKQRLGIAQALLNDPKILVLDEPTAGLDPKERVRLRNILSDLAGERIVLLSTHIVSDVEAIADTVFLMKKGAFILQGSSEQLVSHAQNVWEFAVPQQSLREWESAYTVANLRHIGSGQIMIRVIADEKPCADAVLCSPTLEDLYLSYFPTAEGGK